MPHDWTDCQDLGQPGADKRQTLLLDKGGSSSPLSENQHPHPITSQQLLTISRGLETKAAVSNCDAPNTQGHVYLAPSKEVNGEITPSKG